MKIAPLLAIALAVCSFPVLAEDEEHVPTQAEMNQQAADEFTKADAKLNAAYQKLQATFDKPGQAKLKAAQKAWLVYRDAEAALEAEPNKGGTIYPLVYANVQQRLTESRTKELGALLEGASEEADPAAAVPAGAEDAGQ